MGTADSREDKGFERALLMLLLANGAPLWQPVEQLVEQVGDRTATLRALDRLRAVGLAESDRGLVRPSAAARRFDELGI